MIATTVRNPLCRISILSSGGYKAQRLTPDELIPSLLEVTTSRDLSQPAGRFQITLLPRPAGGAFGQKTWHDLIHPMDQITIKMWVPPNPERVVMTGFVDTVVEQFSIGGGRPSRVVVVAGRDYGKLLLVSKFYALDLANDQIPQQMRIRMAMMKEGMDALTNGMRYRTGGKLVISSEIPPKSDEGQSPGEFSLELRAYIEKGVIPKTSWTPNDTIKMLWKVFVMPQYEDMQRAFDAGLPSIDLVIQAEDSEGLETYSPYYIPNSVQPYTDLWSIFRSFQHAPWRELFWEETAEGPRLYYRSTPWLRFDGHEVQTGSFAGVSVVRIHKDEVIESTLGRYDEAVFNLFFSHLAIANGITSKTRTFGTPYQGAWLGEPFQTNPYLVGLKETILPESSSDFKRMGIRPFEVSSPYFDLDANVPEGEQGDRILTARLLAYDWNRRLVEAFDHGGMLEGGTLSIRGTETIRVGSYLSLIPTGIYSYISGVTHRFRWGTQQDGHFVTTLNLTRGRGHLARTEKAIPGRV